MYKNSKLFFSSVWILGALLWSVPSFAQSEMDLLLFEKKGESANNDSEIDLGIDTKTSLSENLKKKSTSSKAQTDKNKTEPVKKEKTENWLQSLISKGKDKVFNDEDNFLDEEKKEDIRKMLNQRKNAAFFDISGVKLRMTPEEIGNILITQGYKRVLQNFEIPNFIKWRGEEMCRLHGVVGFERLNACATRVAVENGYNFIEREIYNRYSTKESIDIFYTSSFTGNLSHRIFYKSSVPLSDSKSSENVYINNLKIYNFWKRIDLKYGPPDNASEVKWGLGGKKPYLKAKTGYLELADPLLKDLDVARMFNEDTRIANTNYYTF